VIAMVGNATSGVGTQAALLWWGWHLANQLVCSTHNAGSSGADSHPGKNIFRFLSQRFFSKIFFQGSEGVDRFQVPHTEQILPMFCDEIICSC